MKSPFWFKREYCDSYPIIEKEKDILQYELATFSILFNIHSGIYRYLVAMDRNSSSLKLKINANVMHLWLGICGRKLKYGLTFAWGGEDEAQWIYVGQYGVTPEEIKKLLRCSENRKGKTPLQLTGSNQMFQLEQTLCNKTCFFREVIACRPAVAARDLLD